MKTTRVHPRTGRLGGQQSHASEWQLEFPGQSGVQPSQSGSGAVVGASLPAGRARTLGFPCRREQARER
eukprot:2377581-Prymnesium_polylepis.1